MCCIFTFVIWILDLIQRCLTACLGCILCVVICLGLMIAVAAGVAYGYNYSLSEFATFKRTDVAVFMRRGQFYDRPERIFDGKSGRRSNDEEDQFNPNRTLDYQDSIPNSESRALPNVWEQAKDSRKYAEILTKYTKADVEDTKKKPFVPPIIWIDSAPDNPNTRSFTDENPEIHTFGRDSSSTETSKVVNSVPPSVLWAPGSSEMKKWKSFKEITTVNSAEDNSYEIVKPNKQWNMAKENEKINNFMQRPFPTRHFKPQVKPMTDELKEDVDEESIIYKPV